MRAVGVRTFKMPCSSAQLSLLLITVASSFAEYRWQELQGQQRFMCSETYVTCGSRCTCMIAPSSRSAKLKSCMCAAGMDTDDEDDDEAIRLRQMRRRRMSLTQTQDDEPAVSSWPA